MRTNRAISVVSVLAAVGVLLVVRVGSLGAQPLIDYFTDAGEPKKITVGADGRLYFSMGLTGFSPYIGCITADGVQGGIAGCGGTAPHGSEAVARGPDGNVWFTAREGRIGRIAPDGGVTEFNLGFQVLLLQLAGGPDGNMWITDGRNLIQRLSPAGELTEFPVPTPRSGLEGIALGPDGNMWFTEGFAGKIARITPAGAITEFPLPPGSGPRFIAAGPDGNLWYTSGHSIGKVTPSGVATEFFISDRLQFHWITAGPDGQVWFVASGPPHKIGRITTSGVVELFDAPFSLGITTGPDGNIWFTDPMGSRIGRLRVASLSPCVAGSMGLCLNGGRFRAAVRFRGQPAGPFQDARPVPLTDDTGAFWFFNSSNLELMVKVLDGRSINGRFWVFYGSLSNVEFEVTVTDTLTGASKTYSNAQGQQASLADTNAF